MGLNKYIIVRVASGVLAGGGLVGQLTAADLSDNLIPTDRPLTLTEAVDLALRRNGAILQAKSELEANYGVSMQIRSIALPQLKVDGDYIHTDQNEFEPVAPGLDDPPDRRWFGRIRLVQSIYEGGRMLSSLRTARLTKEQAVARYSAAVADTVLETRTAYFDAQLHGAKVEVMQDSTELLEKQAADAKRRYEAGLLQELDVLRAEVAYANARPKLLRARSESRLAKIRLADLLGLDSSYQGWENMSFQSMVPFADQPVGLKLAEIIAEALDNRPEIRAQQLLIGIQRERLKQARSGYKPSIQILTGYGGLNDDLDRDLRGWFAGVQVSWDLFDGLRTQGKIKEAQAELAKAEQASKDLVRDVELEVRTAYSSVTVAGETLEAQRQAQDQAEKALRIANRRFEAGELTQLEVFAAQTALTEARTSKVQTLHDLNVALARLERAIGMKPAEEE